jgi:hypothetical protein
MESDCEALWLTIDGRTPKEVQVLARLKGLSMVQNYSRNFRLEDFDWLDKGPVLVPKSKRRRSA